MADNVAITAGSGTSIATDDVSGAHYQKVKLYDSTADSSTGIGTGNGTAAAALRVTVASDSTGTLSVNSHAVTNAGTFATQVDGAALTALQKIDDPVLVDDAAFTAATSSVMMAGFTLDNTSTDTVDEGDAGAARITMDRRQIVALGESGANYVGGGGSKTDTSAQSIMAASGNAAISNFLGWVTVYNSSATNTAVEIRDGTTTVVAVIPAPAYGGAVFQPTYPIKGTANTAFNAYAQTGVTTLYIYGGGYKAY